jgi:RNA polymerase sigma-70 factor, ECF subfamily
VDTDSNLATLMARYQAGDAVAATELIKRLGPQLHRFFMAQFASRVDADDLLQETWLRLHRVRHTYRPSEALLPWLYAIARRVRIDHYRRVSRNAAHEHSLGDMLPATATSSGDEKDVAEDLETLLAPLSESQREVIWMTKVAGMSLEEVAQATSCSVGAVKQKVHRAYENLRIRIAIRPKKRPIEEQL